MYGFRLWIFVLTAFTTIATTAMVIINFAPSWSQYAGTWGEPLLILSLGSVFGLYLIRSFVSPEKDKRLLSIGKMVIRVEHLNRLTATMFLFIAAFAVWNMEMIHYIVTGCAIVLAHLELWTVEKSNIRGWALRFSSLIGILGFIGGKFFDLYSIGMGESIAALPLIFYILATNKK